MVQQIIKKAKNIFFADPRRLYEEEIGVINQPFYFEGGNGKAVILIHGWTSTSYEVRRLGKYLNENGYTVSGPMLRGHGTAPEDLENIKWSAWLEDIEKKYLELKGKYGEVYVCGTSIGANLAVLLAQKYPEISGLVLMAMPYKLKFESLAIFYAKIFSKFKKYNNKFYPPTFGLSTTITRLISYQRYPLKSVLEAYDLVKNSKKILAEIKQPCFLLQSNHDHMTVKKNMELIYGQIGSAVKKKKYVEKAYHTFISDIKNEHVFQDIINFLNEN